MNPKSSLRNNHKLPDTPRELFENDLGELQEIFIDSRDEVEKKFGHLEHVKQIPDFFLEVGSELLEAGRSSGERPVFAGCCVGAAIIGAFTLTTSEKNDFLVKFDQIKGKSLGATPNTEPKVELSELERRLDDNPEQVLKDVENFREKKRKSLPRADCDNGIPNFYFEASKLMLWLGDTYMKNSGSDEAVTSIAFCSEMLTYNIEKSYEQTAMLKYYEKMG